jgi:hypothetical protein
MAQACAGEIPQYFNLQGRLMGPDGTAKPAGNYRMFVRLYADPVAADNLIWQSNGIFVAVDGEGVFNVEFGEGAPLLSSVPFDHPYYFELWVMGPRESSYQRIPDPLSATSPRQNLCSVPYAITAKNVSGYDNYVLGSNISQIPVRASGGSSQIGIFGEGTTGVVGTGTTAGISGESTYGFGVYGKGPTRKGGILGAARTAPDIGVENNFGVAGLSTYGSGVYGNSSAALILNKAGVFGYNGVGKGVMGYSDTGYAIYGESNVTGWAGGFFGGGVEIARGRGNFIELKKTDSTPNHTWRLHTPDPAGTNPGRLEFGYTDGAGERWGVLTLHPDGRVGIGTTAPDADARVTVDGGGGQALYVNGAVFIEGSQEVIRIQNTTSYDSATKTVTINSSVWRPMGQYWFINETSPPKEVKIIKVIYPTTVVNLSNKMITANYRSGFFVFDSTIYTYINKDEHSVQFVNKDATTESRLVNYMFVEMYAPEISAIGLPTPITFGR